MKKTYWIYKEVDTGKEYLQTANETFAKTIGYMCGIKYYAKQVKNGSTIYSFSCSNDLERSVKSIIKLKNRIREIM